MKKTVLFLAIFSAILTACSKNDDVKNPTVNKLEVVMNIENISADILEYFTIEYAYVDFNGKTVTKPVTKAEKISFSIDNPTLGEESSNPFTVQLKLTQNKSASAKASGTYDTSFKWQLDVNAYDKKGQLITDSGKVQSYYSDVVYSNDKFSTFTNFVASQAKMSAIQYKVFYCKTTSGVWHIGVDGKYLTLM